MYFSAHEAFPAFKEKLSRGELVVGTWINALKDPILPRVLAPCGLDYILIDAEHSGADLSTISQTCILARECGLYPMVRPADPNDLKMNARLMDAGAMGIVVPHIDTPEQARAIANSIRFLNGGTRGYVSKSAASGFQKMTEEAMLAADRAVTCVVQFESVSAVEQADEILAVEGVDVAIIGRGDLALDMGLPARPKDPRVSEQVERVYAAAQRQGKVRGLLTEDVESARKWMERGVTFLTFGSDVSHLQAAYTAGVAAIRAAVPQL